MIGIIAGAAAGLLAAEFVRENCCMLAVRQDTIDQPAYTGRPLKLALVSDTHIINRRRQRRCQRLLRAVRAAKPDLILVPGDLVSRTCTDFSLVQQLLTGLCAIAPVYYAPGNHELDMTEPMRQKLYRTIEATGTVLLCNRTVQLEGLALCGVTLKYSMFRNQNRGFSGLSKYTPDDMEQAVGVHRGMTLLLAHSPLALDTYAAGGAERGGPGHVHGGRSRLPVVGGLLSPERKLFPAYSRGHYRQGHTDLIVSGGIAKPRLFNPPELRIITLRGKDDSSL